MQAVSQDYDSEWRKDECEENRNKNQPTKSTKYASCTSSRQYFISPFRSYQLEVQDQIKINKCKFALENTSVRLKKECKTNLECKEIKCEANRSNNWAKWAKYARCTSSR